LATILGSFSLAQELAVFPFEIDRTPTLAVFPQLLVAAHVFGAPAQLLQFTGAVAFSFLHGWIGCLEAP
jgi:hypothetical protein